MAILDSAAGRACLIALVAFLAACGGGGSVGIGSGGTGHLNITITGLPLGLNGNVAVSGPNGFERTVISTQALNNLEFGTYTVSASDLLTGTAVYAAQPPTQSVVVAAGASPTATVAYSSSGALALRLQQVVTGLTAPVFLTAPPGDPRLFVVERAGRIRVVQNGILLAMPFLDIAARVGTVGEGGLLSMAFDPQYSASGYFFVYFTDTSGNIAVERFKVSPTNPNVADPSPLRILSIAHPTFTNHYGGLAAFGPDGLLYLGTGDGGGGGDPLGNAQNLNTLLGKLLRIDVRNATVAQPYVIPPQNPFVGQTNRRGEIWAYGLRNPWRYAFDTPESRLYIADVGEDRIEEIDVADAGAAGLNYGWNITEGTLCFPTDPCSKTGITLPVLEYAHDASGGCSIIGGYVYRGSAIPQVQGRYFYSDLCSGFLRSFVDGNGTAVEKVDWNLASVGSVFSFGEDSQKELYLLSSSGGVYKIVRQ